MCMSRGGCRNNSTTTRWKRDKSREGERMRERGVGVEREGEGHSNRVEVCVRERGGRGERGVEWRECKR